MDENDKEEVILNESNMKEEKKSYSIASLVLGLVGLLIFALPCGILAIIFGLKGKNQGGKGMATAGFILGIADLVCWLFYVIVLGGVAISSLI